MLFVKIHCRSLKILKAWKILKLVKIRPMVILIEVLEALFTLKQATLIGGGGGILKYPPQRKIFENTPLKFWEKFSKNRGRLRNLG